MKNEFSAFQIFSATEKNLAFASQQGQIQPGQWSLYFTHNSILVLSHWGTN